MRLGGRAAISDFHAAYLNQAVNLAVSLMMVPLLLRYLPPEQFVLWAIFTTLGGLTLQVEASLQSLYVRELAADYHSGVPARLVDGVARVRRAYLLLSLAIAIPFLAIGWWYLGVIAMKGATATWRLEWCIFALTFAANYYFGSNNVVLLALGRTREFNIAGLATRGLNFVATLILLLLGWSVLGLSVSFAISVATNCWLNAMTARRAVQAASQGNSATVSGNDIDLPARGPQDLLRYMFFTIAAFVLFKGSLLIAASSYPKDLVSGYSLVLQMFALLTTMSLVPMQIWLGRLVRAVLADDRVALLAEIVRTALVANALFLAGAIAFALLGPAVLSGIGSRIGLPNGSQIAGAALAFMIEMNIAIIVGYLVTKRRYEFVRIYVVCAVAGVGIALAASRHGAGLFEALVLLPLLVQLTVCAPLLLRLFAGELGLSLGGLLRAVMNVSLKLEPGKPGEAGIREIELNKRGSDGGHRP